MNWNELKNKALTLANQGITKSASFGFQSLHTLGLVIASESDLKSALKKKRLLLIIAPFDPEKSKDLLVTYPILAARCWQQMIDIRWIDSLSNIPHFPERIETTPAIYRYCEEKFCYVISDEKGIKDYFLKGEEPV